MIVCIYRSVECIVCVCVRVCMRACVCVCVYPVHMTAVGKVY